MSKGQTEGYMDEIQDSKAKVHQPKPMEMTEAERRPPRFEVQPDILLTFNLEMAEDICDYLERVNTDRNMPSHVYAFYRQLRTEAEEMRKWKET